MARFSQCRQSSTSICSPITKTYGRARGLPAPKPDWRWSDIKAAAEQLARKRGATIEVYGMADWELGLPGLWAELAEAGFQRSPTAPLRLDDPVDGRRAQSVLSS